MASPEASALVSDQATSRGPITTSFLERSSNERMKASSSATPLAISTSSRRPIIHNRRSRRGTSLSPTYVWILKAVVVFSVLVLVKYYTARYVKCLQPHYARNGGSLPGTEKRAGSTVRRRLADASEVPNISSSNTGDDPEADRRSMECLSVTREELRAFPEGSTSLHEAETPEQHTSNAVTSIQPKVGMTSGIFAGALLISGLITGLALLALSLSQGGVYTVVGLGVFALSTGLALAVLACARRNNRLGRLFGPEGVPGSLVPSVVSGLDLERGESPEASFPITPVEHNGKLSARYSIGKKKHLRAVKQYAKERHEHANTSAAPPLLKPEDSSNPDVGMQGADKDSDKEADGKKANVMMVSQV